MRYPDEVYGIYAKSHDITFVMKECFDDTGEPLSLEVTGFYYGEPNERDNKLFSGDLKADFAFDKYVNGPQFPVIPDKKPPAVTEMSDKARLFMYICDSKWSQLNEQERDHYFCTIGTIGFMEQVDDETGGFCLKSLTDDEFNAILSILQ